MVMLISKYMHLNYFCCANSTNNYFLRVFFDNTYYSHMLRTIPLELISKTPFIDMRYIEFWKSFSVEKACLLPILHSWNDLTSID